MNEFKRQLLYIFILLICLLMVVLQVKTSLFSKILRLLSTGECSIIPYTTGKQLCFGGDVGVKMSYPEAKIYCQRKGMHLPTREEAWYIWISSENCGRYFAAGINVAKDFYQFKTPCNTDVSCKTSSVLVDNYCKPVSIIKFPLATQYKNGNFWLAEENDSKNFYSIDYSTGSLYKTKSQDEAYGVRCVKD